jgi:hypothetical protein
VSGIAGIYYPAGWPVDRTDVERMLASLAHRGLDGAGVWCDEPIGFGHWMLWTIPESLQETLPLVSKTGNLDITADARIDNRDALIDTLCFVNRLPRAISAVAVVEQKTPCDARGILAQVALGPVAGFCRVGRSARCHNGDSGR